MHGELAQLMALATHGTAWLAHPERPAPALEQANTTFQFVRTVTFRREGAHSLFRKPKPAGDVASWFEQLRAEGTRRLWLEMVNPAHRGPAKFVDEHLLVAFAGAGSWVLLATGERAPVWWRGEWTVHDIDAPDRRIWDVTYVGRGLTADAHPSRLSTEDAATRLRASLVAIREFALHHDLTPWIDWFARALDALDPVDAPAELPYHADMIHESFPAAARRLAGAGAHAWVFGGMGSWNDLGFATVEDNNEYNRLSSDLYAAVLNSFVAAVNIDL